MLILLLIHQTRIIPSLRLNLVHISYSFPDRRAEPMSFDYAYRVEWKGCAVSHLAVTTANSFRLSVGFYKPKSVIYFSTQQSMMLCNG